MNTSSTDPTTTAAAVWRLVPGGTAITGGLLALCSLPLPWLSFDAYIVRMAMSPFDLWNLEERFGVPRGQAAGHGLAILLAVALCVAVGVTCGTVMAVESRPPRPVAPGLAVVAGAVLLLVCGRIGLLVLSADSEALLGSVSPGPGLIVGTGAGLAVLGGGLLALLRPFLEGLLGGRVPVRAADPAIR
ncbi:hypothetical protein [Catellatospora bangladeshensis]|uniref:Uncharacterized protein n=1 Tax=Catellatospora bangladeshensis TaxID=310355 RepID=A0A8J3NH81_9ACTN|nr:hypothetical protein [Catellatospora bangladeshensis]GIF80982.1 hypothetical protein Cba03nite_23310 [Catellatospora bangladeshensis]